MHKLGNTYIESWLKTESRFLILKNILNHLSEFSHLSKVDQPVWIVRFRVHL